MENNAERLLEIQEEMEDLVAEALSLCSGTDRQRAERGWAAEIQIALSNDHGWLARGGHTLQDSIDDQDE